MIITVKTIVLLYGIAMLIALVVGIIISKKQNRNKVNQEPAISVSNSGKPLRDSLKYLKPICK